jgi:hypothetical protein
MSARCGRDARAARPRAPGRAVGLLAVAAAALASGCFVDTTPTCVPRRDDNNAVIGMACRDSSGCVRYTNLDGGVELVRCGAGYGYADGAEVTLDPPWRGFGP